jgi:D-sedoheptulose 7-phosphate isomerase
MQSHISELIRCLELLSKNRDTLLKIEMAVEWIVEALKTDSPLLVCGNGGSASDAMHISGELVGRFKKDGTALNVICLNTNVVVMTAWANDFEYDSIFARQVEAHASKDSVFLGISTSGESANIIRATIRAKELGLRTISLTGGSNSKLTTLADLNISVPSTDTPVVQELHLPVYHYICQRVEEVLRKF